MRTGKTLFVALLLSLCFTTPLLAINPSASAAEDVNDAGDEYEERARVMRVTLLKGEASLRRAGNSEWEDAKINLPLVEGDTLATGRDSHMEVQVDARNFVRLGPDSVLKIITLRDEGIALSLSEGTATLRLARFDSGKEYFEIDAPKTTMAAEKRGLYRLDVSADGSVRVTVRDEGRARIYNETSGFVLRNNRTARLSYDPQGEGDWELSAAADFDGWDIWNDERERYLAQRLRHEGRDRYYDPEVWGAEELDFYGDWVHTREYGYVWRPHTTVISRYRDWAPYRYGHWRWCPPYGWTWIPDEDWGWAPYHHGRWVYINGNWCWAPRGYGYHYKRAWWRPALVAFYIDFSTHNVCWYPLRHGQRDPRGRFWSRAFERLEPLRRSDARNLRRADPALLRAVSTASSREFGSRTLRARPASAAIAQKALTEEPVRGRLPITPGDTPRVGTPRAVEPGGGESRGRRAVTSGSMAGGGVDSRGGLTVARPAPVGPARSLPDRETGAAPRTPGAPLDAELRRIRIFNGREPRQPSPSSVVTNPSANGPASPSASGEAGTGAVLRPNRTDRRPPSTAEGAGAGDPGASAPNPMRVRPTRPVQPNEDAGGGAGDPGAVVIPRARRPDEGTRENSDSPRIRRERPSDTPASDRPVFENSEPRVRPSAPESRPEPRSRGEESHTSRPERSAPREERSAPRSEPREERSAPRHEAPPRSDPPPRNDPPPSRQESPRNDPPPRDDPPPPRNDPSPPPRNDPPPQRSEPSRDDSPRPSRSNDDDRPARVRPDNRR